MGIYGPSAEKAQALLEATFPGLGWIVVRNDLPGRVVMDAVADWDPLRKNKQEITPSSAADIASKAKQVVEERFESRCTASVRDSAGTWGVQRWDWKQPKAGQLRSEGS